MKILVLGNSDTTGRFSGGVTWPQIVAREMEQQYGERVDLALTPFLALNPASARYAEEKVRGAEPDLVLMSFGTAVFTVGFVSKRVERLFGKRVARWYRRMEAGFDDGTRGKGGMRGRVNAAARTVIRRVVGSEAMTSEQAATEGLKATLAALARMEHAQVALIAAAPIGSHHHRPGAAERRRRFLDAIRRATEEHHFTWIEAEEAYRGVLADNEVKTDDPLHQTAAGHETLGRHIAAVIAAGRVPA